MTAEQAATVGGKYIRIRSMRSLHNTGRRANGSLLGVKTVVEDGEAPAASKKVENQMKMDFGTIWKLEPTATAGKYHIVNVASQFEGQNNGNALATRI